MGEVNKGFEIMHEKTKQIREISLEVATVHTWECPSCAVLFQSTEDESEEEFIDRLYEEEEVRYVKLPHMIGLFCKECYTDPEVQESTL